MKKHGGNVYAFASEQNMSLGQVIDFSANINPLGPAVDISQVLDLNQLLNYPDPDYIQLKAAIASFEGVAPGDVIAGNGAIECIFLLAEALKSRRILIQAPTFIEYERAFGKYGATVTYQALDHETFTSDLSQVDLEQVDAVVICNPNNPTGTLTPKDDLLELVKQAKVLGVNIIVDEAFIDFTADEAGNSMVKHVKDYDNLFVLKSLTKFFAIPGLRLGYLLTSSNAIKERIQQARIPWTINSVAEQIGIASIRSKSYIEATKKFMIKERHWFIGALREIPFLKVFDSHGNYVFFKSQHMNLHKDLAKFGIMIRNCDNYENLGPGYYRVAIKSRSDNEVLLKYLKEIKWKS